mmetsp:Transcript_3954/g.6712  ORF Transcript_3954/g.6712 Transcript_3954/m.6712 type:complete len:261 (+) Transcript_3954:621-1403(+)
MSLGHQKFEKGRKNGEQTITTVDEFSMTFEKARERSAKEESNVLDLQSRSSIADCTYINFNPSQVQADLSSNFGKRSEIWRQQQRLKDRYIQSQIEEIERFEQQNRLSDFSSGRAEDDDSIEKKRGGSQSNLKEPRFVPLSLNDSKRDSLERSQQRSSSHQPDQSNLQESLLSSSVDSRFQKAKGKVPTARGLKGKHAGGASSNDFSSNLQRFGRFESKCGKFIYHLSIVDYLQETSWRQKLYFALDQNLGISLEPDTKV